MPIQLPALSRRAFLQRAIAASSALAFAPQLFANDSCNSWALLADTHIAGDTSFRHRNVNLADHLSKVVQEVVALSSPCGTLIAGDCAFGSGQDADYRSLGQLLQPLRQHTPIHFLLGNHDHRERFWKGVANTKANPPTIADHHVALIKTDRANWYLLDSLETTNVTPGLLGSDQLQWLANTLDAHPKTPALVVIHHNPGIAGNMGLKDTVALFDIIRPRKQVKAYIYGHTHAWGVEHDETGIHLINLPPVAYVFNDAAPSGWVHALTEQDFLRLTLSCIDKKHRLHGQQLRLEYRAS